MGGELRDIRDFENQYAVTDDGRVWSHKRKIFMRPTSIYSGYVRVRLRNGPKVNKYYLIHRLVADAFIPNPVGKLEVHHINGVRNDNRLENLGWVTRSENNQAAWTYGAKKFVLTEKHISAVKAANYARRIRSEHAPSA